jgi:hypothetical protein
MFPVPVSYEPIASLRRFSRCCVEIGPIRAGHRDFSSTNNSAVMGSTAKPHLGIASGILATMRNVGMVLGVAAGGAVLYAFAPSYILQKASLELSESALFLSGLKNAYLVGAILTELAGVASLIRGKNKHR